MKTIVRISMTLVALSAAALSFQSPMHLGELCGYGTLSFLRHRINQDQRRIEKLNFCSV